MFYQGTVFPFYPMAGLLIWGGVLMSRVEFRKYTSLIMSHVTGIYFHVMSLRAHVTLSLVTKLKVLKAKRTYVSCRF